MEKDKKIKEPFEPRDTPEPPQIIEPDSGRQRENPVEGKSKAKKPADDKTEGQEKPHLLSEDADINDETTI